MNPKNRPAALLAVMAMFVSSCLMVGANADELAEFAAPLNVEYQHPDVDFAQFQQVLLTELDVGNVTIVPPPWLADKAFKWQVNKENVAHLQVAYAVAMTDQI